MACAEWLPIIILVAALMGRSARPCDARLPAGPAAVLIDSVGSGKDL